MPEFAIITVLRTDFTYTLPCCYDLSYQIDYFKLAQEF